MIDFKLLKAKIGWHLTRKHRARQLGEFILDRKAMLEYKKLELDRLADKGDPDTKEIDAQLKLLAEIMKRAGLTAILLICLVSSGWAVTKVYKFPTKTPVAVADASDLSAYWKSDGTSTATGNWDLGSQNLTTLGIIYTPILQSPTGWTLSITPAAVNSSGVGNDLNLFGGVNYGTGDGGNFLFSGGAAFGSGNAGSNILQGGDCGIGHAGDITIKGGTAHSLGGTDGTVIITGKTDFTGIIGGVDLGSNNLTATAFYGNGNNLGFGSQGYPIAVTNEGYGNLISIGLGATFGGYQNVVLGTNAYGNGSNSVIIGADAGGQGGSVVLGASNTASNSNSVVIGGGGFANGYPNIDDSLALGGISLGGSLNNLPPYRETWLTIMPNASLPDSPLVQIGNLLNDGGTGALTINVPTGSWDTTSALQVNGGGKFISNIPGTIFNALSISNTNSTGFTSWTMIGDLGEGTGLNSAYMALWNSNWSPNGYQQPSSLSWETDSGMTGGINFVSRAGGIGFWTDTNSQSAKMTANGRWIIDPTGVMADDTTSALQVNGVVNINNALFSATNYDPAIPAMLFLYDGNMGNLLIGEDVATDPITATASIAIGDGSRAGDSCIQMGYGTSTANTSSSMAFGYAASINSGTTGGTAIGNGAIAGQDALSIGGGSVASGVNSIAIGSGAVAAYDYSLAFCSTITTDATYQMRFGGASHRAIFGGATDDGTSALQVNGNIATYGDFEMTSTSGRIKDNNGTNAIYLNPRLMQDGGAQDSLDWGLRHLLGTGGTSDIIVDWSSPGVLGINGDCNFEGHNLFNIEYIQTSNQLVNLISIVDIKLNDGAGSSSLDWGNRQLWVGGASVATWASGRFKATKNVDTHTGVTSITPNSDTYDIIYATDTAAAGTFTVNADTGSSQTEGQSLTFKINCTNAQTFSWTSGVKGFYGGSIALPTTTSGASKTDIYSFYWDSLTSHWLYTGSAGGF